MDMRSAVPDWLTPVAWTYITLSLLSALIIASDIYLLRRRHPRVATELVWITSALYLGPVAVALYLRGARTAPSSTTSPSSTTGTGRDDEASGGAAVAVLPGGGASAVAHLIAVPAVAAVGWTIAGLQMWPMILVIAVLATVMLAVYERVTSRGRRGGSAVAVSVGSAVTAAFVTVVAFDIGMVGWMLLLHVNELMPPVTEGTFWFLMQIGVVFGLATGYPAVRLLLRRREVAVPA